MNLSMCYMIMFMSELFILYWNHKHIMMSLLSLQFIILTWFFYFSVLLSFMMSDLYTFTCMLIIFLTFSECEGVLGLWCMVMLILSHGNNNLLSINLLTC